MKRHLPAVPIGDIPNDPENYDTDQIGRAWQGEAQRFECGKVVLHSVALAGFPATAAVVCASASGTPLGFSFHLGQAVQR
jgi:hypothetical protein